MDVARFVAEVRKRESLWSTKFASQNKRKREINNDKLWREVASIFNISKDRTKRKWRNLRDTYTRMLRVAKKNGEEVSPWVHFETLSFLTAENLSSSPVVTSPTTNSSPTEDAFLKIDEVYTLPQDSDTNMKVEEQPNFNNTTYSSNQSAYGDGPPPLVMIAPQVNIKRVYTIQDDENDESILSNNQQYSHQTKRKAVDSDFTHSDEQATKETDADNENLSFFRSLLPFMNKLNTVQQLRMRIRFHEVLLDELRT